MSSRAASDAPSWSLGAAVLALVTAALAVASPAYGTFPGGNGRIAYTWSRGGDGFESPPRPRLVGIVSARLDGSDRRLIARGGVAAGYSPNGRLIAFLRSGRLWVARANGEHARPLTPNGWSVGDYEWSPGGRRLAFVRVSTSGTWHALYKVGVDGRALIRLLTAPQGLRLYPGAWSPKARAIIYEQHRITGRPLVRIVRSGRVRTISRIGYMPTWSRRGLIAVATPAGGEEANQVCIMRAASESPLRCFGGSDPAWSPDGRRLMVLTSGEIRTMRPDGSRLTRAPRADVFPTYSPDGRWLAFSTARFGGDPRLGYTDLYRMRLDGTTRERVVRGGQAQAPDWQPLR